MKIYVLGDSISIDYGPYLEQYLNGLFEYARKEGEAEARLNLDQPMGANGGDSSMVLNFLEQKQTTGGIQSDFILINCGLHDIKTDPETKVRQISPETYESNLCAIIKIVTAMRLKLIWIRTTPCDEAIHNHPENLFLRFAADVDHYNQIADKVMKAARIPIIDLNNFTRNLGHNLYRDHIHFHSHISEKQAAFIAGWLHTLLY